MKLSNTFLTVLLPSLFIMSCTAQKQLSETEDNMIKATDETVSLRAGADYWENCWKIRPDLNPATWYVMPDKNESIKASYITDIDSISVYVKENEIYNFKVLLHDTTIANIQIEGVGVMASFDEVYQNKYSGKTIIEIPDVYELINIVFALTSLSAEDDSRVVYKSSQYHEDVMDWFSPYKSHIAVTQVDSILRADFSMYFGLKMDTYIYKIENQKIVSKEIYNRLAQRVGKNVVPSALLRQLEDFSKISNFSAFYAEQKAFYNSQIDYYKNDINIANMQKWLNRNYRKTSYDCFRVIFSPLVDWNQSAAWIESDGFKEAQAHVNFPYPSEADKNRSEEENKLLDGNILFTEFNHAFNDPEAEEYFDTPSFTTAFGNTSFWCSENSIAARSYADPGSLFNELMNWSLVSLYLLDSSKSTNINKYINSIEEGQINRRGFKHFRAFNQNLIKLYKDKKTEQTVADLYPEIIKWCELFKEEMSN